MACPRNPKRGRRTHPFAVTPGSACFESGNPVNCEIVLYSPLDRRAPRVQVTPEFRAQFLRVGQDQSFHSAAANEAVVPAKIVVQQQIKRRRLAGFKRLNCSVLDLRFQATSSQSSGNTAVVVKNRFGAELLRARTFHAGDDPERDGLTGPGRLSERSEKVKLHTSS